MSGIRVQVYSSEMSRRLTIRLTTSFGATILLSMCALSSVVLLRRLMDRLPIAVSSMQGLNQGQHAFHIFDRLGETDGAWHAPANLWHHPNPRIIARSHVCRRFARASVTNSSGSHVIANAIGCRDLGMDALAVMGKRGWAHIFVNGDLNPLREYMPAGEKSLTCGWISPEVKTTLIFSFGHQSNIFHFYFLHLLPVYHISRILKRRGKDCTFSLDTQPMPPLWALEL